MSDTRSGAARLEKVGELMREATPPASLQQHLEGRARLIASVEKMRKPSRARPALVAFAFAAAVAASVLVVMRVRSGRVGTPIAWHVENGAASAQGYVSIPPTAPSHRDRAGASRRPRRWGPRWSSSRDARASTSSIGSARGGWSTRVRSPFA